MIRTASVESLPTKKAARFLGVSERRLYEIRSGALKWTRSGGKTFYTKTSLEKLLKTREN